MLFQYNASFQATSLNVGFPSILTFFSRRIWKMQQSQTYTNSSQMYFRNVFPSAHRYLPLVDGTSSIWIFSSPRPDIISSTTPHCTNTAIFSLSCCMQSYIISSSVSAYNFCLCSFCVFGFFKQTTTATSCASSQACQITDSLTPPVPSRLLAPDG